MEENTVKRMNEMIKRFDGNRPEIGNEIKREPTTQDFVKKMRKVTEEDESGRGRNRKTMYDQTREEENFRKNFEDLNVTVEFIPLEVYDDFVFWGGTIDGIIQFVYKVTPDETTSGVEFNYLEEFSIDNPDNDEVVKRIESYYDQFYKYWRDNVFQTES